jgi:hypothetical protein
MPRVGFETMTPALERAKTIHALDRGHYDTRRRLIAQDIIWHMRVT